MTLRQMGHLVAAIALVGCACGWAFAATDAAPTMTADALIADARQALAKQDNDAALAAADKAVTVEPRSVKARLFRAGLLDAFHEPEKALADYDQVVELDPKNAQAFQWRGVARFKLGKFAESVADFDTELALRPANKPYHWQRGIALYYAGDFKAGQEQFEMHKAVNPGDVENAAWHFLCVAKQGGVEKAKELLIPVAGDSRVPMVQVHDLYAGKAKDDDVIRAALAGNPDPDDLKDRLFYAHLYIGLHDEVTGNAAGAKEHIDLAAGKYAQDHYMGWVAKVHAKLLEKAGADGAAPAPAK